MTTKFKKEVERIIECFWVAKCPVCNSKLGGGDRDYCEKCEQEMDLSTWMFLIETALDNSNPQK